METQTTTDFWPADIGQETGELSPGVLLKEQAVLLSNKTKGLVTAEVRGGQERGGNKFVDKFYLIGPAINYQYLLMTLEYPFDFYPARIYFSELHPNGISIPDSETLGEELAQVFSHEKTRQVINAIIQRSK